MRDLMTDSERSQADEWQQAKWESLVRYVSRLSRADQIRWAGRQSETTLEKMREALKK